MRLNDIGHKARQLVKALHWQKQLRAVVSFHLALLENPGDDTLGGLTAEEESRVVELIHAAAVFDGPIVEFGTLFGITTQLMAAEKRHGQRLISVDNFSWNPFGLSPAQHEALTRRVLRRQIAQGRVLLYVGNSAAFRSSYNGVTPSLVFFDADHSYETVLDEISWAKTFGVPLISGHDYGNNRFGVTRAVDASFPNCVSVRGSVWSWDARKESLLN